MADRCREARVAPEKPIAAFTDSPAAPEGRMAQEGIEAMKPSLFYAEAIVITLMQLSLLSTLAEVSFFGRLPDIMACF